MDAALSLCRKALGSAVFPGRIDILPLDGRDEPHVFDSPPIRADQVERFMGELARGAAPTDFEKGLQQAIRTFRASPHEHKELYVLSDFSAADLGSQGRLAGLFRALNRMDVRIYGLSYANDEASNFALHEMTPHIDALLAGQPTIFYITVGYYGASATADTWMSIRDQDDNALFEDTLTLAPGRKTLQVPLTLPAGDRVLTASLKEDDYLPDNRLARSFQVAEKLHVVVAQDIDLSKGFSNPREWIKLAAGAGARGVSDEFKEMIKRGMDLQAQLGKTAPPGDAIDGKQTDDGKRYKWLVEYVNSTQIAPGILDGRDGAIFLDIDMMLPEAVEAARLYAVRGGTILLAPGPTADPAKFNEAFASVSPARIRKPKADKVDPDVYESAVLEKADDLVLRELESPQHGNIGNARFYRSYHVVPDDLAEGAEVLFSLSDGSPLCMLRPLGRGACLLWTAGLGMEWHSMVVHPSYPVFFSRLFNIAAARRRFAFNLEPGEPLIREIETQECLLVTPEGEKKRLDAVKVGGKFFVRYDRTDAPGTYLLLPDPEDPAGGLRHVVRADRRESDYRPVEPDRLDALEQQIGSSLHYTEKQLFDAIGRHYLGPPLMAYAAVALLLALVLEAGLARRWFT